MSQVITPAVDAAEAALAPRRVAVADTVKRQYGAVREYAEALCQFFPSDWYTYEHNDKSEASKGIRAEADKFRKTLREAGHTNPSVIWTRVRNEGRKLVEGEPEAASGDGDGDGDGDKAGTKEVRSLRLRFVQELCLLHKAAKREEAKNNLPAQEAECAIHIAAGLKALGVDLTMVK